MNACNAEGCEQEAIARGYCNAHYLRVRATGEVQAHVPVTKSRPGERNPNWRGGKTTHPLYDVYHDLRRRCLNPRHIRYRDYGGRGIRIHPEWAEDFWAFVRDVGERPEGKTPGGKSYWQIDRIDNDRGYEPGNVRWATPQQQANNKRGFGDFESRRNSETGRFE